MPTSQRVDVLVAGAGVAGLAAATLGCRRGLRVALVHRPGSLRAHRTLCLTRRAVIALNSLGLAGQRHVESWRTCAGIRERWAAQTFQYHPAWPRLLGPAFVEQQQLEAHLREALFRRSPPGLSHHVGIVRAIKTSGRDADVVVRIEQRDGSAHAHEVRADQVVDATAGRLSRSLAAPVAKTSAARAQTRRAPIAVGTVVDCRRAPPPELWLAACPTGWIYALPKRARLVEIVWMTDADIAAAAAPSLAAGWRDAVDSSGLWRQLERRDAQVGRVWCCRAIRPPTPRSATSPAIAIGDALGPLDPLSGRGIERCVLSAAAAIDLVAGQEPSPVARLKYDARWAAWARETRAAVARAYAEVTRWSDARFWARRQQTTLNSSSHALTPYAPEAVSARPSVGAGGGATALTVPYFD